MYFYLSEVKDLGILPIPLPGAVNRGDPKYRVIYAPQHFTTAKGQTITGAPIQYTITIPSTVHNEQGAEAFVQFILGSRVRAVAAAYGLLPMRITVGGDRNVIPSGLTRFLGR